MIPSVDDYGRTPRNVRRVANNHPARGCRSKLGGDPVQFASRPWLNTWMRVGVAGHIVSGGLGRLTETYRRARQLFYPQGL